MTGSCERRCIDTPTATEFENPNRCGKSRDDFPCERGGRVRIARHRAAGVLAVPEIALIAHLYLPSTRLAVRQRAVLRFVQAAVDTTRGDQLVVTAFFLNPVFGDDDDAVGVLNGGEAVGDDESGATL